MQAKTIGILVYDGVQTTEVTAPAVVFRRAIGKPWLFDWQVKLIGTSDRTTYTSWEGLTLTVDATLDQIQNVDVLIVPGSADPSVMFEHQALNTFIKRHGHSARWLASNCSGAFLLGHSGVLDGLQATTWSGGETLLAEQFPKVRVQVNQPVVIDRRRLTSNGGRVSYDAAFVLLGKLVGEAHSREIFDELQSSRLREWKHLKTLIKD